MFLHRISWDVARRQGSGCGGTLGGPIPRKVGMWVTGKHTTFSCREGQARRNQGSIPPSPKLLLLFFFFSAPNFLKGFHVAFWKARRWRDRVRGCKCLAVGILCLWRLFTTWVRSWGSYTPSTRQMFTGGVGRVHAPVPTAPLRELECESRWASDHTHHWVTSHRFGLRFSQTGTVAASRSVLEKKTSDSTLDQQLWLATAQQPQQVGWINTEAGFLRTMERACVRVCVQLLLLNLHTDFSGSK